MRFETEAALREELDRRDADFSVGSMCGTGPDGTRYVAHLHERERPNQPGHTAAYLVILETHPTAEQLPLIDWDEALLRG